MTDLRRTVYRRAGGHCEVETHGKRCGTATARTNSTPDHNSLLSAAESQTLARIAQDRRSGFMVSGPDVDFLLEVIARLTV